MPETEIIKDGDPVFHVDDFSLRGEVLDVFDQNGTPVAEVLWDAPNNAQFLPCSKLRHDLSRMRIPTRWNNSQGMHIRGIRCA